MKPERPRRLPSIPPDAKGIPWAEWEAQQKRNPQRNAEPEPTKPEWCMTKQERVAVFGEKPKQPKRGKDKAA